MGDGTKIEWSGATWNAIRGCQRTAPEGSKQSGCGDPSGGGCYAERQAARFCGPGGAYEGLIKITANGPRWSGKTRYVSEHLLDPLRWKRARYIFTDSMSDLFYKGVEQAVRDRIVAVMMIECLRENASGHVFQTLTKRGAEMRDYFRDPETQTRVARAAGALMEDGDHWYDDIAFRKEGLLHPRMWWGVSVENQAAADERIPQLLETPAAVRFLSIEPLLGPVDLGLPRTWLVGSKAKRILRAAGGTLADLPAHLQPGPSLDWAIVGSESGPGARECRVEWVRGIRDQLADAGVALFLKQANHARDTLDVEAMGGLVDAPNDAPSQILTVDRWLNDQRIRRVAPIASGPGSHVSKGRGYQGRAVIGAPYLDGVQHKAFPDPFEIGCELPGATP